MRLSQYPQSPAFLEACDEMGVLVLDAILGWQYFGDSLFIEHALHSARELIRRDRNHPSLLAWELSINETPMPSTFTKAVNQIAREEFPNYDVTVRGAVSIGRRLMEPLAELVKIDPNSIGVGQYQHDVDQGKLKEALDQVVESCVNKVGVNVNTAGKYLLTYVSGLGPTLAENVVEYIRENGAMKSREELKKVKRMGSKAFEQCAGFLRIENARNPLDNSAVHPESYYIVEKMARDMGVQVQQLIGNEQLCSRIVAERYVDEKTGILTLKDIVEELKKPGRDPRTLAKVFSFAEGISKIEDLKEGMVLPGIVTNLTSFGAFVDVGVKELGLVLICEIADRYVANPADVLSLHQQLRVKVVQVDSERKRIGLSIRQAGE